MSKEKKLLTALSDEELAQLYVQTDEVAAWLCSGFSFEDFFGAVELEICRRFCKLSDEQHFWHE